MGMTNTEAIKSLNTLRESINGVFDYNCRKQCIALDMAIQALEQQPSEDCISREEALKVMCDNCPMYNCVCRCSSYRHIEKMLSVTPQPKMGRWIAQDIHNCHTDFKCSECGYIHSFTHLYGEPTADYTYCPNCGARMQEVEE